MNDKSKSAPQLAEIQCGFKNLNAEELKLVLSSQKRKQAARLSALKRRANKKAPMFCEEIIQSELKENSDYFSVVLSDNEIRCILFKAKPDKSPADYSSLFNATEPEIFNNMRLSWLAAEYQYSARRLLIYVEYLKGVTKSARYHSNQLYRAAVWHKVLTDADHRGLTLRWD